jgi:D-alanyl-D-alanine carboxypeptidase
MKKSVKSITSLLLMATMVVLVLAGGSCGSPGFPSSVEKKLDRLLSVIMEQSGIPGAVAGIWVPGEGTWVRAVGKSDVKSGTKEAMDYRFRIGSITKTFTATVVLQLADEGKLSLDDKLDK